MLKDIPPGVTVVGNPARPIATKTPSGKGSCPALAQLRIIARQSGLRKNCGRAEGKAVIRLPWPGNGLFRPARVSRRETVAESGATRRPEIDALVTWKRK